jgi:hypothetical protein
MQNKGLIIFRNSICIGEYLPTFFHFVANKVKNDAKALLQSEKEAKYLIPLVRKTYLILIYKFQLQ